MNAHKWVYKPFYYFTIGTLFLGIFFLTTPSTYVFSATGDSPTISISPVSTPFSNNESIVITGTYTSTDLSVPKSNLVFTAYENDAIPNNAISNSDDQAKEWNIGDADTNGMNGNWTFTKTFDQNSPIFSVGTHTLIFEIKDRDNPDVVDRKTISITINPRPYVDINSVKIFSDNAWKNAEDMTKVDQNAKFKIVIVDNNSMDIVDRVNTNEYNPFTIVSDSGSDPINGSVSAREISAQPGNYQYEVTFNPNQSQLFKLSSTFLVFVDPAIKDSDNSPIIPRVFKFTTKSYPNTLDPHGRYEENTNACAICHSTHTASDAYSNTSLEKVDSDAVESYCMACHDGTTAAPMADRIKANQFPHNYSKESKDHLKRTDTCTSCHDPHSGWSETNPNMLKGHFVYTHTGETMSGQKIDSDVQSCESCHTDDSDQKIGEARTNPNVYQIYSYKKADVSSDTGKTLTGISEDYSLCLRCHTNIKNYYEQNNSKHRIESTEMNASKLGHNPDETAIDGNLPCAECHETHGSDNSFLLKTVFGHENKQTAFSFTGGSSDWTPDTERTFCEKCHNGSTRLSGVTGQFDMTIPGHTDSDVDKAKTCSSCHSSSGTIIEAVHSPKEASPTN